MYGIVAAIRDEPGIRMITTRHEQATTYMADGYARASGKPGVALVVPGVGLYNAAAGLATAYSRSSPVLLIAGQIPRAAIGKNLGAVHEISDQPSTVRSVTKWQRQTLRPREIPDAVFEAFRQMRSGRPRVVHGWRWGVHVQLIRAFHGGKVRNQCDDRHLQERRIRQRGKRPGNSIWRSLRD